MLILVLFLRRFAANELLLRSSAMRESVCHLKKFIYFYFFRFQGESSDAGNAGEKGNKKPTSPCPGSGEEGRR